MIVEKYKKSSTARINMLEAGDVFRTDSSYTITDISEDYTVLKVKQSINTHPDNGQTHVRFDTPVYNNTNYAGRNCTLDETLRVTQISIRDKFFVVAGIEYISYGSGHKITAVECDAFGNQEKDGVSLEFHQDGYASDQVYFPHYVSHNDGIAAQAKQKRPKVA